MLKSFMRVLLEITPDYFRTFTEAVRDPETISPSRISLSDEEVQDIKHFSSASRDELLFTLFESWNISSVRPSLN